MRRFSDEILFFSAATATGTATKKLDCRDFRNQIFIICGADTPTANVKIKGSAQEDVDFSAAASSTNRWDYIQTVNLQSRAAVAGDTGVTVVAGVEQVEANNNTMKWMTAEISAISGGNVTVYAIQSTNE